MLWVSLHLPQPRSSRTLAAAMRAIGGEFGSIMIPASVLMAVRVYDRASDAICPRFFGIFRSSCFVSIRYNPHRRWQTNQVEAKLALKAASIESQYSREAKAERACGYRRDSI